MSRNTAQKILDVANELFAKFGYEGTSIRDIAEKAGVNLAAINYHFQNKQTLYWEIYMRARLHLEEAISEVAQSEPNLEELACRIYRLLLERADFMRNTFKLILSESAPEPPDEKYEQLCTRENVGPPGQKFLLEALSREMYKPLPDQARLWAVRGIFTFVAHWALMGCTSHVQKLVANQPGDDFSPEQVEKNIRLHVHAITDFLEKRGAEFDS